MLARLWVEPSQNKTPFRSYKCVRIRMLLTPCHMLRPIYTPNIVEKSSWLKPPIVVIVVVSRQNTQRNNTLMAIAYILLGLNLASEHAAAANAASEVPVIASRAAAPLALLGALAGAARAAAQLLLYS
jgi:hypothetical protein